ncbi:MAG: Ppx/GppA family phosphatase [Clostridia bacterium]|nr:Ppx/GppA family phosphatase [Clostridia bacterium]
MMKAAMDIGTNSTRLLIATPEKIIHQETTITRIGEGLKEHQLIQDEPLARTIRVLKKYKETLVNYGLDNPGSHFLVATSAMRDALNKDEVVAKIKTETGFRVEIISGEREAELSYLGATGDFPGRNIVIDIGGGSTEVIFQEENLDENSQLPNFQSGRTVFTSTNLGGVRLKEDPGLCKKEKIVELFAERIPSNKNFQDSRLIGVGGTITTIAAVKLALIEYQWEKIHGLKMTLDEIKSIHEKLKALPLDERKKVPGLQPERADIIIYGTKILITFMEEYGFREITASDKDLLFALVSTSNN